MKKFALILIMATLALAIGCAESQEDKDLEALRACVDSATRLALTNQAAAAVTQANVCDGIYTSKNLTSKDAKQISFGILLIQQQKMSQISNMVTTMSSGGSANVNSLNGALTYLAFDTSSNALKAKTLGDSLGGGAQVLGGLIYMATTLQSFAGGAASFDTAGEVKTAITNCITGGSQCTSAQKDAIAAAAIAYKDGACATSADLNSTDPNNNCYKARQIVGNSTDTSTILSNLLALSGTTS